MAELAGHAPVTADAVAETVDQGLDHFGVIDAAVVGSGDGTQIEHAATLALGLQGSDILDTAGEAQIVVEAIGDVGGGLPGLTEVARRGVAGAGQ